MGNNTEWIAARTKTRLEGMKKSGPGRVWMPRDKFLQTVGAQRLERDINENTLDEKPSTYRVKPKRRA